MKQLILKAVIFFILGFIILNITAYWLLKNKNYISTVGWRSVLRAINNVDGLDRSKIKVIILGDSVGNQIFPRETHPNSLTSNGSVLAVGHYILAYNAIKRCRNLKYVVLASIPSAIGQSFERKFTYNNVMKPFYTFENLPLFSELIRGKINQKRLSHFVIFPFIKIAPFLSDIVFSGAIKENVGNPLSDLSMEYLKKLYRLCRENDIKLIVVSPPVPRHLQKKLNLKKMKAQIIKNKLGHIFKGYFKSIMYLAGKHFEKDNVHLNYYFAKKNRRKLAQKILPKEVLLNLSKQ